MSDHKDIYSALLAAQAKFKKPEKNAKNSHFKNTYADLEAVVDAVEPALHKEGVVHFSQLQRGGEIEGEAERIVLRHVESGTELETVIPLLMTKRDMQQLKAARTYARRMGLEDLTGVAPGEDDDAETNRQENSMGAAIKDAWKQGVLDKLPENASPREKAEAFAQAIIDDFSDKEGNALGDKALRNRYSKHAKLIEELGARFRDLHEKVIDAYERRAFPAEAAE